MGSEEGYSASVVESTVAGLVQAYCGRLGRLLAPPGNGIERTAPCQFMEKFRMNTAFFATSSIAQLRRSLLRITHSTRVCDP